MWPAAACAGRGGTGDTWAFKDLRTGEVVAVKFIKRPLPKVLLQNIQREFTVSSCGSSGGEPGWLLPLAAPGGRPRMHLRLSWSGLPSLPPAWPPAAWTFFF